MYQKNTCVDLLGSREKKRSADVCYKLALLFLTLLFTSSDFYEEA